MRLTNRAPDHASHRAGATADADLAVGAARRGAAGAAGRLVHHRDGRRRRARGSHTLRASAGADGVSRPRALGIFQCTECAARQDHEGRESARAAAPRGSGLGVSRDSTDWPTTIVSAGRAAESGLRHRVESPTPVDGALPPTRRTWQIETEGRDGNRARAQRIHLGDRA